MKNQLFLNRYRKHIKLLKALFIVCISSISMLVNAQTSDEVSSFLDSFLSQIEDGGLLVDESYLSAQTGMPEDIKSALQDSLQGRESFVLLKENAGGFLSAFTSTLERYGIQSEDGKIKLKNNRFLNLELKGPNLLSDLFGGRMPVTSAEDTIVHTFPVKDINTDLYQVSNASNIDLQNPSNHVQEVQYDASEGDYLFSNRVGDEELNVPVEMSAEEYLDYSMDISQRNYWDSISFPKGEEEKGSLLNMGLDFSGSSQLFGPGGVSIKPKGYADLTLSVKTNKNDNPTLPEDRRKTTYFDLDNKIQMNVLGSVGDRINLDMNYNTEATFDFDNEFKLEFNGKEDDIMKHFNAGNVSMPSVGSMITLGGSSGGQSGMILPGYQKLMGFQNTQQYGKLTWAWVVSQQESETETMTLEGGATKQDFSMGIDDYDANRHFFLTHFFKDNYDNWMSYLPNVEASGLYINKVEVWVTNKRGDFDQARNMLAFMDLAEPREQDLDNPEQWWNAANDQEKPSNNANALYGSLNTTYSGIRNISDASGVLNALADKGFIQGEDYEKVENARLLSPSEYRINKTLGYISLTSALNADEVLGVAFQYTYRGQVYQVGEFSSGNGVTAPDALFLKLLKSTNSSPSLPTWDLMMKNIYALDAYNISQEDFTMSVMYQNDKIGTAQAYINEGEIKNELLLRVMGLDQLNSSNEQGADGFFDWVEGYTISSTSRAQVIFPSREPFGSHLSSEIGSKTIADAYVFQELYDTTLVAAQQMAEKNKFTLQGSYKSASGSEIKLNAYNIPRGSVKVTAGGKELVENVDYTVDYNSGFLRILNQGVLESGQSIQVSMENQAIYSMQKKTLLGSNLVYRFSDDLQIGASVTHLRERPQTTKVAVGNDPIANTVWGFTGGWHTELPFLTKVVDKLPFTDTKAASSMTVRGEVAQLIAGHHKSIGDNGSVYLDDFESTKIGINVQSYYAWDIASVPTTFDEAAYSDTLAYGYNRAKLAWYSIDLIMQQARSETPSNIKNDEDERSNHYVRSVDARDLFPKAEQDYGESTYVPVLNLAYYPDEKGPYNFDTDLDDDGRLKHPEQRWAGITRKIETPNFENSNIEYIEFWMMDPYIYSQDAGMSGEVFFNLGNISEDVLRDGRKSFENGLPSTALVEDVDTTAWGRISTKQSLVNAFDNNESAREYQDVGMDGLSNEDEKTFFASYLAELAALRTSDNASYIDSLINDPSQDDYHFYRGDDYDDADYGVIERYKHYNNYEGNSPSSLSSSAGYSTAGTSTPDGEDINQDYTLSETDSYYEYSFKLGPSDTVVGTNYIVDTRIEKVELANDEEEEVKWYQYRIPVQEYERVVGSISDFTSIRFMRMYMTGFEKPVIMRMANFELVRSEWRRYGREIEPDIYNEMRGDLDIEAVNFEENSERENVNYILPPDVTRQTDPSQQQLTQLNEQSMVMRVRNLSGRDSRAAYKVMQMDFRQYEKLQMWVHAEQLPDINKDNTDLEDEDLSIFVRVGSDYNDNYYEYELPLYLTPFSASPYNSENESDRYIVWPEDNRLDVDLELFTDLKILRNNNDISTAESFTQVVVGNEKQKVSIKGNPSLSNVRMVMIGVRNTKAQTVDERSAEIWVNELRLTGLDEDGGWAGNGSVNLNIADLGTASATGAFSTAGFGNIEQTLMERQMTDNRSFDVSTSLELGKLLPRKARIQLPMYYAYSKNTSTPKYDPLNQDLIFSDVLDGVESSAARDSLLSMGQDFESRRSLNFSNVKVNIKGKKRRFYDPVNLSMSYAFTEVNRHNETIEHEIERERRFSLSYNYSPSPKPFEPFKKVDAFKSDYLALIRDFNIYLKPQKIAFSSRLNRDYYEQQSRDLSALTGSATSQGSLPLLVKKDLFWDNSFSLNYKLAKSLSMDFSAKSYAEIDEIDTDINGRILEADELDQIAGLNQKLYGEAYDVWWNDVQQKMMGFGRIMDYAQTFNVRYNVPLAKIPLLNFMTVDAAYNSSYGWERGSEGYWRFENEEASDSVWIDNGNLIRNTQKGTLNASLSMIKVYNKSKYLSDVRKKYGRIGSSSRKKYKTLKYKEENISYKKGDVITVNHKLGNKNAVVRIYDANGKAVYGRKDNKDENTLLFIPNVDIEGGRIEASARVEDKATTAQKVMGYTLNALMGVRTVNLNMTRVGASTLPGFREGNDLFTSGSTPGWDFALGMQDRNLLNGEVKPKGIVEQYEEKGWLVTDSTFSEPYMISSGEQISVRATVEPLPGLSIKLNSTYNHNESMSAYYYVDNNNKFDPYHNMTRSGNYSHTWMGLHSFFEKRDDEFYTSAHYDDFLAKRQDVADLRRSQLYAHLSEEEIALRENVKYDQNSPEILIPAFLSAYGGESLTTSNINVTPSWRSMLPNWQLTYSGLAKAKFLKPYFKNITLRHNYTCTYNIGNYMTLTNYDEKGIVNVNGENYFSSEYDISSLTISEGMNPLIGLDMTLKNNLSFDFSVNKMRSLALNIASNQMIESTNDEIVIGAGYRFEDFQLLVRTGRDKKGKKVNNDLRLNADFSIRDVVSIIRRIEEDNIQPSSGNKVTALKVTANYNVNSNLEVTLFYDRQITNPVVSTSFRTMNSNFGMTLRFSLTQ